MTELTKLSDEELVYTLWTITPNELSQSFDLRDTQVYEELIRRLNLINIDVKEAFYKGYAEGVRDAEFRKVK